MMFTGMRLLSRRNICLEAIKKTVPITPMVPGLKPTYGREHPGHVIGFTRLVIIIIHPGILSILFYNFVNAVYELERLDLHDSCRNRFKTLELL